MSSNNFNAFESSDFLGRQVRLYTFTRGQQVYRNNNSEADLTYDGELYPAYQITDDGIKQKGDVATDDFTVTVPLDHPVAVAYRGTTPSDLIKLTVRMIQFEDDDAPLVWTGYVSKCRLRDEMQCDLVCNSQVAYLNRRGLRLGYSRQCPHALYDEQCKVPAALWGEGASIVALSAKNITFGLVNPNPGGRVNRFTGGFIEFNQGSTTEGTTERRAILSQTNNGLLLYGLTTGLVVGSLVVLYPGCEQVPTSCKSFNNIKNYGGWIMLPGKSPFDGDPVF